MLEASNLSAKDLAQSVREGQLKLEDIAAQALQAIEQGQADLNCQVHWSRSEAQASLEKQISSLKRALNAKQDLPLAGVPILVKDNIMVAGEIASCGSRFLANHRAAYDATVIERLRAAGALICGRTNMDEFGMGSSNENSAYGPVRNPWNREHVAGGSSGGSAAAVAAGLVPLALGSDTGGSIRQPASFCGVMGLKPTYGRVSRYGLVAYGSSLDQIGPMARCLDDIALAYDVIAGPDTLDSTSASEKPVSLQKALEQSSEDLTGLKIATVKEYMGEGLDPEVRAAFEAALAFYKSRGASLIELSLPTLKAAIPAYYILATAEASANLARFDGVRYGVRSEQSGQNLREMYMRSRSEGFGREVKQRIMLGTYVLSAGYYEAFYGKASRIRAAIREELSKAFADGVHLIASPTAPTTAFPLGQKTQDSLAMYLSDVYTIAANLAGVPAISHPIGRDSRGLPIGLQFMAPAFEEQRLLVVAREYERQMPAETPARGAAR